MNLELIGKVVKVLPLNEGVSKAGKKWKKGEFVVETNEQYPTTVNFSLFGEKYDKFASKLIVGADLVVKFNVKSTEFNGRYFTELSAWDIAGYNESAKPEAPIVAPDVPEGHKPPMIQGNTPIAEPGNGTLPGFDSPMPTPSGELPF